MGAKRTYETYAEKMYLAKTPDEKDYSYSIKPMNCIGGMLIYKTKIHSYKDLPIKSGEIGLVHRYEGSGEVHGLMRLRQFTQDDAHIYCRPDQVKEEIVKVINLCFEIYKKFGLEVVISNFQPNQRNLLALLKFGKSRKNNEGNPCGKQD